MEDTYMVCCYLEGGSVESRMVHNNRHDDEGTERELFAWNKGVRLFQSFIHLFMFLIDRRQVFRCILLYIPSDCTHVNGQRFRQLRDASDVVAMIVCNQQRTFRQIAMSQTLNLQLTCLWTTWQFFAIIDKQPPTIKLVLCDATTYLVCATMDCNFHCLLRLVIFFSILIYLRIPSILYYTNEKSQKAAFCRLMCKNAAE